MALEINEDRAFDLRERLAEAEAIQEMAARMKGDSSQDFEMLRNASRVTFRLISEAREILEERS